MPKDFAQWLKDGGRMKTFSENPQSRASMIETYFWDEHKDNVKLLMERHAICWTNLNSTFEKLCAALRLDLQAIKYTTPPVEGPLLPGQSQDDLNAPLVRRQAMERLARFYATVQNVSRFVERTCVELRRHPTPPQKVSGAQGDMSGTKGTGFEAFLVTGPAPFAAKAIGKTYYAHTGDSKENHADMKWMSNHKADLKEAIKTAVGANKTIERVEMNDTRQPCQENCAIEIPKFAKKINDELQSDPKLEALPTLQFYVWTFKDDDGGSHVYYIDQDAGTTVLIGDW